MCIRDRKYDLQSGTWYLIRPDHHIAARGRKFDVDIIQNAMDVSLGKKEAWNKNATPDLFSKYRNDDKYKKLIEAHKGLSKTESDLLNHKLMLLLLEEIDVEKLAVLVAEVRKTKHG